MKQLIASSVSNSSDRIYLNANNKLNLRFFSCHLVAIFYCYFFLSYFFMVVASINIDQLNISVNGKMFQTTLTQKISSNVINEAQRLSVYSTVVPESYVNTSKILIKQCLLVHWFDVLSKSMRELSWMLSCYRLSIDIHLLETAFTLFCLMSDLNLLICFLFFKQI